MKNLSANLTQNQILESLERVKIGKPPVKTVTRRVNWIDLKPGTRLQIVNKAQGLKKGEHPVKLAVVEVVSTRRERLREMTERIDYGLEEVKREGFHDKTPHQFVQMFCEHMKIKPTDYVTRIEFKYIV